MDYDPKQENINGLLEFIDYIQDSAASQIGEENVFGFPNTMKTKVIFRKFKDVNQDVIALFPEESDHGIVKHNLIPQKLCKSYMRLGQHSSADYQFVISVSVPAKLQEYRELKKELEDCGYNLEIIKKIS